MSDTEWEKRYAQAGRLFGDEPSPLLTRFQSLFPRGGRALALGDGEGRNSVWLAGLGLQVTAIEQSPSAITKARAWAANRGVGVDFECKDVLDYDWPPTHFDLIISIFLHLPPADREVVQRKALRALRPGGVLIIEGYHPDHIATGLGGPRDPAMLYDEARVAHDFSSLQTLHLQKCETTVTQHGQVLGRGVALQYIGRRV